MGDRPDSAPGAGTAIDPYPGEHPGRLMARRMMRSLFDLSEEASPGAIAVDRDARIVWLNERYAELLGLADHDRTVGRPVEDILPNSMMREVVRTGRPILLDIMKFNDQSLVVTRIPVHDDHGRVDGAVGFVLYDDLQPLTPLVAKYRRLQRDLAEAHRKLARRIVRYELADFIGASAAALEVKRRARLAAQRDTPVLLLGETGTGKEVLAQAVHAASPRAEGPFVGVSLAAVPENLLEAEFFGVAPGAYTGADRRLREGKFQLANGGTLFLDEVGDMPIGIQAKLLRVLQEQEVEPLGSNHVYRVDVRIIAATSRDLPAMVEAGEFRADLYYRLNVLQITVPPLRERLEDVGALCDAILDDLARRGAEPRREIGHEAVAALMAYHWPGNIRELRNILEQALALTEPGRLLRDDDLRQLLPGAAIIADAPPQSVQPLAVTLAHAECRALQEALHAAGGNRSRAARLLGISRSTFYEKLLRMDGNG